jgi:hypothetical protein
MLSRRAKGVRKRTVLFDSERLYCTKILIFEFLWPFFLGIILVMMEGIHDCTVTPVYGFASKI